MLCLYLCCYCNGCVINELMMLVVILLGPESVGSWFEQNRHSRQFTGVLYVSSTKRGRLSAINSCICVALEITGCVFKMIIYHAYSVYSMTYNLQNMQCKRLRSVETMVLFFAFCGPEFTKCVCTGEIAVCNAIFLSTIFCFIPDIFAIKLPSGLKFVPNFDVFGPFSEKIWGPKNVKIWDEFQI